MLNSLVAGVGLEIVAQEVLAQTRPIFGHVLGYTPSTEPSAVNADVHSAGRNAVQKEYLGEAAGLHTVSTSDGERALRRIVGRFGSASTV